MGTPGEGLERLRAAARSGLLDRLAERLGLELLVVFGSVLAGSSREPRDLDVAVRVAAGAGTDRIDVTNELIDLTGCSDVDVMDLASAGVVARARALGPGSEALFESTPGAAALAQMAALSYAMETAPLRRLDLELLAER